MPSVIFGIEITNMDSGDTEAQEATAPPCACLLEPPAVCRWKSQLGTRRCCIQCPANRGMPSSCPTRLLEDLTSLLGGHWVTSTNQVPVTEEKDRPMISYSEVEGGSPCTGQNKKPTSFLG